MTTDKAQYRTGQDVEITIVLRNKTGNPWKGSLWVRPRFLGQSLGIDQGQAVSLGKHGIQSLTFSITEGCTLDRGYLVEIECVGKDGTLTDFATTSFDYADDWSRFPRYGYLTLFDDETDAQTVLEPLRDYKINAIQYYDWMDEHHIPYRPGTDHWNEIANRPVSKTKLIELIQRGHQYNIAAMAYNLMFGAYDNYPDNSDVELSWGAFTAPTGLQKDQDRHELNIPSWETPRIYLFNPSSQEWRDWMTRQFKIVFDHLPFDGWHIDTLGVRGDLYEADGTPFDMDETYPGFVNNMRATLGLDKDLVVNAVSTYGLNQLAKEADVDVIYTELWHGDTEDEFYDIKLILDQVASLTDKQTVIAGYMNTKTSQTRYTELNPGIFNEPGILLADAVIFANGGWHIELGDGLNMLSTEYFPNKAMVMSASTKAKLLDYYNFAVAYENLLRDDVSNGEKRIELDPEGDTTSNYTGTAGGVWKISRIREGLGCASSYDISHLINLGGAASAIWRDLESSSSTPVPLLNKTVRLYYDEAWEGTTIWYASPDEDSGTAKRVTDYVTVFDSTQSQWFVEFTLPRLEYWVMIWLERRVGGTGDCNCDGRIDLIDLDAFSNCLGTSFSVQDSSLSLFDCRVQFDFDRDDDVDERDFAEFQNRFGAEEHPAMDASRF